MKWRPRATADIHRLCEFLREKNPEVAARAAQAILDGAEELKDHPLVGRPMNDDTGRREWFVSFGAGAYVLRYMLEKNRTPIILRVWHSKENRN